METLKDIVATTVGSAACVLVGQPFDTIKVRVQVLSTQYGRSSLNCVRKTITEEGVVALWKGYIPAFAGAVTENATAFVLNGIFHRLLDDEGEGNSPRSSKKSFLLGAGAGFFTAFVLCPTDVVKCREQVLSSRGQTRSAPRIALDLYRKEGCRGFSKGIGPQVWRDVAFFSFFFGSYEYFNAQLQMHFELPAAVTCFVSGGLAGQVAWLASLPMDMVKSIVQTSEVSVSPLTISRQIYQSSGVRGFYRGVGITLLRAFPSNAALFLGYEFSKSVLSERGSDVIK